MLLLVMVVQEMVARKKGVWSASNEQWMDGRKARPRSTARVEEQVVRWRDGTDARGKGTNIYDRVLSFRLRIVPSGYAQQGISCK
jgi:hypothetical protein